MITNLIESLVNLSQYIDKSKRENSALKIISKTPLQTRIEAAVTNGRSFDNFGLESLRSSSPYAEFINSENLRETREGLDAYLFFMDFQKNLQINSKSVGYTFGNSIYSDKLITWFIPSKYQTIKTNIQNLRLINKAYNAQGKRMGGRRFLKEKRKESMQEKLGELLYPLFLRSFRDLNK